MSVCNLYLFCQIDKTSTNLCGYALFCLFRKTISTCQHIFIYAVRNLINIAGQYDQNLCNSTDPQCLKCPLRLPSCIGESDGNHAFPTKLWKSDYITCFKNRTVNISRCTDGYFHPNLNKCTKDVARGTVLLLLIFLL